MAVESESGVENAEKQAREAEASGSVGRPRLHPIIVDVMHPSPPGDRGPAPPSDRIVLANPLMQGMVVLQGNPELVAELLSGREDDSPPSASRALIEAMKTVEVGKEEEEEEAAGECLDELAGAETAVVKEMPRVPVPDAGRGEGGLEEGQRRQRSRRRERGRGREEEEKEGMGYDEFQAWGEQRSRTSRARNRPVFIEAEGR